MDDKIVNRIKEIMENKQLTSTHFAKKIGVNNSSIISHILSGRNKPSLDIVRKILHAFPDLDRDWLLFGEKGIYPTAQQERNSLFSMGKDNLANNSKSQRGKTGKQRNNRYFKKDRLATKGDRKDNCIFYRWNIQRV